MLDAAVFASSVHGPQYYEKTPLVLRVEACLKVLYAPALLLQLSGHIFFPGVVLALVRVYRRQGNRHTQLYQVAW